MNNTAGQKNTNLFKWPILTTQTHTIRRGAWDLPHKFHLFLINSYPKAGPKKILEIIPEEVGI